jgi:hypothetical protein
VHGGIPGSRFWKDLFLVVVAASDMQVLWCACMHTLDAGKAGLYNPQT